MMNQKRVQMVLALNIPPEKLKLMRKDAEWYSKFSSPDLKKHMKFSYKRITKIIFAEYFIGIDL